MAGNIATAAVLLTADSTDLDKKLQKTGKDVESWGQRVGAKLKSVGGSFLSFGKTVAKGIGQGVGFALGKLGIDSIGSMVDKLTELKDIGDYAQGLGTTGEEMSKLAGLAKYAGTDVKNVVEGLATLNKMVADAGKGGEADKLFKNLGVDATAFKGMDAYGQFMKLFEVLNKSEDPMGRFQMLMAATGEDVGKLMLKLSHLSNSELEQLANKYAYTNKEIAEATVASEAYADAQLQLERASTKLAIALAPVVDMLSTSMVDALNGNQSAIGDWGNAVMPVFRAVAMAVARVSDVFRNIPDMLQFSAMGWVGLLGKTIEGIGDLTNNQEWKDFGKAVFQEAEAGATESINRMKNFWELSDKTAALFDMKAQARAEKVDKLAKKLEQSTNVKGLNTGAAKEMKPLDAAVYGSSKAQESYARNQGQQQQTQIQLARTANQILTDINKSMMGLGGRVLAIM